MLRVEPWSDFWGDRELKADPESFGGLTHSGGAERRTADRWAGKGAIGTQASSRTAIEVEWEQRNAKMGAETLEDVDRWGVPE